MCILTLCQRCGYRRARSMRIVVTRKQVSTCHWGVWTRMCLRLSGYNLFKALVAMLSVLWLVAGSKHAPRASDSANIRLREYGSRVERRQKGNFYVVFLSSLMYWLSCKWYCWVYLRIYFFYNKCNYYIGSRQLHKAIQTKTSTSSATAKGRNLYPWVGFFPQYTIILWSKGV